MRANTDPGVSRSTRVDRPIRWRSPALPAAFLVLAIAAGMAALALWSRTLLAREDAPESRTVEVSLADRSLLVPRAWVIGSEAVSRPGRPVARLALEAPLREVLDLDTIAPDLVIGLTLLPADDAPPPSERPSLLYNRFLEGGVETSADGLIRRAFVPGSPYEGEILLLAPPRGRAFAARCLNGDAAIGVRLPCLAEIRRAGLDVQVRLPRSALVHWPRVVAAVDRMVAPSTN